MSDEAGKGFTTLEREALICGRCGYCRGACPVYQAGGWESDSPRGKITLAKEVFAKGKPDALYEDLVEKLPRCTLCGACANRCSTGIDTRRLWLELRRRIARDDKVPGPYRQIRDNLLANKNISQFSNDDRLEWAQDLDEEPEGLELKAGAEVAYFVGCVSSFFPQAAQIPLAVAEIFTRAGVDFTTLGGEEWCCGFPLISTGFADDSQRFIEHNSARIKELGIHKLVASCASCYHVWKHDSLKQLEGYDLEVLHTTEYLLRLIREGRIQLEEFEEVVAYHDPCDLGRNSGVYDAPREIIRSIPRVGLVELRHNRADAMCCGGGGNLQSIDPDLVREITRLRVEEIRESGATVLVSACQQCEQVISAAVRKAGLPVRVLDVSQLILEAMG